MLATVNLLLAGQGPWGPGMSRAPGLLLQPGPGPVAPSHPWLQLWFPALFPSLLATKASGAVCLPCPGSVLTWAWDEAPSAAPLPSLLQRKGVLNPPGPSCRSDPVRSLLGRAEPARLSSFPPFCPAVTSLSTSSF